MHGKAGKPPKKLNILILQNCKEWNSLVMNSIIIYSDSDQIVKTKLIKLESLQLIIVSC